jgi:signal transduction histidine kinase
MNKVTIKVFFTTMLVIFISSFIPNIIAYISTGSFLGESSKDRPYFLMVIVSVFMMILVFNFIMNKIVYKRINKLNQATKEVMNGNYDIEIDEDSNDEITEVIRNFNIMIKELKSNEYQNKEFIRNISHELKTPLSAIKGYSDLIIDANLTKEEQREYATIISNESKRLTELSKNMLLISMIDSKMILNTNDKFNVSEQIRNIIQFTQLSWEEKNLEFDLDLHDQVIETNKELLYQVWLNLVSNSIKFSPSNSTIKLDLSINDNRMNFSISNQGLISSEDIDKIFDLFYIPEKSRSSNSSGVGLALVKNIIGKLDGDVKVESYNNLTTFTINLPISY